MLARSAGGRPLIDLHTHVLPGLDDGPATIGGSLDMARAAVQAGTRIMAATPHIGLDYPVSPGELAERLTRLDQALVEAGIALQLVGGGELAAHRAGDMTDAELEAIALGGSSCLLLEAPFVRTGGVVAAVAGHLQRRGFRVLLGHPERSPDFLNDPSALEAMVRTGVHVQITAASLRGDFGRAPQQFALRLLDAGLVHAVASDAHDAVHRPPVVLGIVADVVRRRRLPHGMTSFVTEDAPAALLADGPVPPTPRRRLAMGLLRSRRG